MYEKGVERGGEDAAGAEYDGFRRARVGEHRVRSVTRGRWWRWQ